LLNKVINRLHVNIWRSTWCPISFSHSLNCILMIGNIHNRHTRNLPHPPLQILIACGYNVDPMLPHSFNNAVISICSFMLALQFLKAWVLRNLQSNSVFNTKLLQLCNNTISHIRNTYISGHTYIFLIGNPWMP
jgi:hypothetical protein